MEESLAPWKNWHHAGLHGQGKDLGACAKDSGELLKAFGQQEGLIQITVLYGDRWRRQERTWEATATAAKSLQLCPTLCDPIPGILQARTLEWVAISFSNERLVIIKYLPSWKIIPPNLDTDSPDIHQNPFYFPVLSCFSHVRLCDPMNFSSPGSSVRGILLARILERVAISFSSLFS